MMVRAILLALSVDPSGALRPIHNERCGEGGETVATPAGQIARRLGND